MKQNLWDLEEELPAVTRWQDGRAHTDAAPWFENRSYAALRQEKGWRKEDEGSTEQRYIPSRYMDGPWERIAPHERRPVEPFETGIGRYPVDVLEEGPHAGKGPLHYHRPDSAIYDDLCERLTRDATVDASEVQVHVQEGVVTLEGFAESRYTREVIESIAERVPGVMEVQSSITVPRIRVGGGGGVATTQRGKKRYLLDEADY